MTFVLCNHQTGSFLTFTTFTTLIDPNVKDVATSGGGSAFFSTFANTQTGDWTELRDTWERSHAVRACLHVLALIAIAMATSLFP